MNKIIYISFLFAVLMQSCLDNNTGNEDYISSGYILGKAEKSDVSSILTDDSINFLIKNVSFPDSVAGTRVYATGHIYKGTGDYDYKIELVNCFEVDVKVVKFVSGQAGIDTANNADFSIEENIFQTGKYLNIIVKYGVSDANRKKHLFEFIINSETEHFENNRVTVNICHSNGGDKVVERSINMFYSLDLTNIFEKFTEDFDINFVYEENRQKKNVVFKVKNIS